MLGDVEETVYVVDDEDEAQENVRTVKKASEMLFVRGKLCQHMNTPLFAT